MGRPLEKEEKSNNIFYNKSFYALGLDVGGTRLKAAIVDTYGKLYFPKEVPTEREVKRIINQILKVINALLMEGEKEGFRDKILGIGIGVTGQVDFSRGRIIGGIKDKLLGWIGTPLREVIEKEVDMPVLIDNDGKVAALAEYYFGGHGKLKSLVCLTLGTGVGGGIVINGEIYRGAKVAGEIGHMTINFEGPLCGCGHRGCLEAYVSSSALISYTRKLLSGRQESKIYELCKGDLKEITPEIIARAAKEGDPVALKAIRIMGKYLGIGLANIVNVLNPEVIVISGGLSKLGELLLEPAKEALREYSFGVSANYTKVVLSSLGSYAGVIGAATLVFLYFHALIKGGEFKK